MLCLFIARVLESLLMENFAQLASDILEYLAPKVIFKLGLAVTKFLNSCVTFRIKRGHNFRSRSSLRLIQLSLDFKSKVWPRRTSKKLAHHKSKTYFCEFFGLGQCDVPARCSCVTEPKIFWNFFLGTAPIIFFGHARERFLCWASLSLSLSLWWTCF